MHATRGGGVGFLREKASVGCLRPRVGVECVQDKAGEECGAVAVAYLREGLGVGHLQEVGLGCLREGVKATSRGVGGPRRLHRLVVVQSLHKLGVGALQQQR